MSTADTEHYVGSPPTAFEGPHEKAGLMSSGPITAIARDTNDDLSFSRYRLVPVGRTVMTGLADSVSQRLVHIGSSPDNDVVIDDPTVSRVHARLEFVPQGYRLTDLSSKNGTWVNDVRIHDGFVADGATVGFGHARLSFQLEAEQVHVELSRSQSFGRLIGVSSQMREIFAMLARVSPSDVTVLVEGDSGTGKELAAEAVHLHSSRRTQPFVIFDCSAVAAELVESELFGHVKGAFTGAIANREGVFAEADGGTLFIDEVGELPLDLQPKLLRALESGEVKPVGSNQRRRMNVRVIAATNRNLERAIEEGTFREDLYYRLAVIKVRIPPLRRRSEDIPALVEHFLSQANASSSKVGFQTMKKLQEHAWPGNVRELKNYIERAVVLADHGGWVPRDLGEGAPLATPDGSAEDATNVSDPPDALTLDFDLPFKDAKARLIDRFERRYWSLRLEEADGNISHAARLGGIHRKSLEYLLKKHGLR